jgi:hypothetical protein
LKAITKTVAIGWKLPLFGWEGGCLLCRPVDLLNENLNYA